MSQPPPAAPGIKLRFPPEPTSERCVPPASAGRIGFFAMLSGPARHRGRPGGVVRCLVSACLLSLLLEARGSYPQSGECKGKGKDCTGKTSTSSTLLLYISLCALNNPNLCAGLCVIFPWARLCDSGTCWSRCCCGDL